MDPTRLTEAPAQTRARQEWEDVLRSATLRRLWAALTGQNNHLVPFEDLKKALGSVGQLYRGAQVVPLDKVIGSLGRSNDFDRAFAPIQAQTRVKWVSVDSARLEGIDLPPVTLYKVGEAYFVVDGHHRISVARQKGQTFIDAEVFEVTSRVPVTADLRLEDLDVLAAYRAFIEQTKLDVLRPGGEIHLTMPGDYVKLLDHIRVHKYFMEREQGRELSWDEAVTHWYDTVYLPLVQTICRDKLFDDFPGHTEADLYLWIIEHAYYLSQRLGRQLAPWEAASDFVRRFSPRPRRLWARLWGAVRRRLPAGLTIEPRAGSWREERLAEGEHALLFRDILVTVTGAESGWRALMQAAEFAQHEGSTLHGLHVVTSDDVKAEEHGRQVLAEFATRCQALSVPATTSLAKGRADQVIIERARWADLVVINQRMQHGRWAERPLGTIFEAVATQAARPLLVVPGTQVMPLRRMLLAYDGSPKAREALFVFRHLLCRWRIDGLILTVANGAAERGVLDLALRYIQETCDRPVTARYEQGEPRQAILRVMETEQADLLLLGGYGYQPLLKAFLGSTVDRVLREAWFPVLICR